MRTLGFVLNAGVCLMVMVAHCGTARSQTLSVTAGLQLWLKADAGMTTLAGNDVAFWEDQSGQANHAYPTGFGQPPELVANALNGKPVLRFNGLDDGLWIADSPAISITGDLTSFFVVRFDDFATYRAVWGKTYGSFPAPTDYYTLPGSGIPRAFRGNGTDQNLAFADGGLPLRAGSYLTVGFEVAGTVLNHYLGSLRTGGGDVGSAVVLDRNTSLAIGTRADLLTPMKGDIAELLIYNRALPADERASVVDYLEQKYALHTLWPTVTLSATPAGPDLAAGTVVTLNATASDLDGTVARVEFLVNGGIIATATAPPFSARIRLETPPAYEIIARATDDSGGTGVSAPIHLTVPASATPPLSVTAGLQLWMKADAGVSTGGGGELSQWADQSGHANIAFAFAGFGPSLSPAAINGKPAIHFDGVNDYLEVPDSDSISITGDMTTFFVVRMADFDTFRGVWAKTAGNLPAPNDIYTLPGSGVPRLYRGDGTGAGIGNVDGMRGLRAGSFEMVAIMCAGTATTHYLNGLPNGAGNMNSVNADLDAPLKIGTRDDFVTRLSGDLAELLIYNTALSAADRRSVELYLASKYALPLATPVNDAPVETAPKLSITRSGDNITVFWPLEVTGWTLDSTLTLVTGSWQPVTNVINNTVTEPSTGRKFYRLRKP
jgi:hypothetical protein